jgi:hypothetical protein
MIARKGGISHRPIIFYDRTFTTTGWLDRVFGWIQSRIKRRPLVVGWSKSALTRRTSRTGIAIVGRCGTRIVIATGIFESNLTLVRTGGPVMARQPVVIYGGKRDSVDVRLDRATQSVRVQRADSERSVAIVFAAVQGLVDIQLQVTVVVVVRRRRWTTTVNNNGYPEEERPQNEEVTPRHCRCLPPLPTTNRKLVLKPVVVRCGGRR